MEDGRQRKGGEPSAPEKARSATEPAYVPGRLSQDRSTPLTDPMRYVRQERADAVAQIDRSLKAWRKESSRSSSAQQAAIPQSGGSPLPATTRQSMERELGADLSDTKIHTGADSAKAAEGMNARALTVGNRVHFGAGEFAPGTKEGDRLLAHELTHVVQGQKSGVQRKADDSGGGDVSGGAEVSQPHEPAEKEADGVGDRVADKLHAGGGQKPDDAKGGGSPHDLASSPQAPQAAPAVAAKLRTDVVHRNPKNNGTVVPASAPGSQNAATGAPAAYDAKPRKVDELWTDCTDAGKRVAALAELTARGYNQQIVAKILAHDEGRTPRAFVSVG
jgi:hypothetical protein